MHLEDQEHPLMRIISCFEKCFFPAFQEYVTICTENVLKLAVNQCSDFVRIMFFACIKFYNIDLTGLDLRKDLLINMITTAVMRE